MYLAMAAAEGSADACFALAVNFKKLSSDPQTYIKYMKLSADMGNMNAQYHMGTLLGTGDGVEKDFETAYYWYQKAANQNYEDAKLALSRISNFIK